MNCERPQVIEAQAPQIVGLLGIERELAASCSPVILKASMDDNEDVQVDPFDVGKLYVTHGPFPGYLGSVAAAAGIDAGTPCERLHAMACFGLLRSSYSLPQ